MKIINDTLKTPSGKWSRTSLTMFFSFWFGSVYSFISLYKYGFDFWVFLTFLGVATGMKVIDIFDKHKGFGSKTTTNEEEAH